MKIASLFLLSIAFLSTSCSTKEAQADRQQRVRLVEAAAVGNVRHSAYPGKTHARTTSSVAFRVSGTIASIPVKAGSYVSRGQVIAEMDDRDYRTQLKATEAEYLQIKAECERVMALYNEKSTSENNYDKARYGLEQITAKYEHHKSQLADCSLTAPFDGYVQDVLHDAHETVAAGMPVMTIFASNGVEIVIYIPSSEYQQSSKFAGYSARFDVIGGKTFPLRLLSISRQANANQLYEMRLLLEGTDGKVTPGMTAMVDIEYKAEDNVPVMVPAGAVFVDGGVSSVFVYDAATSAITKTPVVVKALSSDGNAMITQGLRAGQQVVASGVHHLQDGEVVTPNAPVSNTNVGGIL